MSEEVGEVISEAPDMSWDNIEDTAPSVEDGVPSEEGGEADEWDQLDMESANPENDSKAEDEVPQDSDEESKEEPEEDGEKPEENTESKSESDDEEVAKTTSLDDLPDDTKLTVKVDGEMQEITLKDYKNGISGEKAIAKRFNEYNVKEKEFESQMSEVNEYINDLGATMRDSSILDGVSKIGDLVGMPPHQLKEALIKELIPEVERRYGLSPEELALEVQTQENEYLKSKSESDNVRLQQEQAQRDLDAKVYGMREAHNISEQEWKDAESTLLSNNYKKEEVTPELVVQYKNFQQAETRAESIVGSFDKSYLKDNEVMDALVEQVYDNPNLSDDEFREVLENALGKSKVEEAEKKVEKAVKAKASKVKKQPESEGISVITNDEGGEISDWDDLL